jgi:hypothetical protein
MANKQTSIEWLEQEFLKLESTVGVYHVMYELIEHAKQIEKVNTLELIAFMRTQDKMGKSVQDLYEQYYNETYGHKHTP